MVDAVFYLALAEVGLRILQKTLTAIYSKIILSKLLFCYITLCNGFLGVDAAFLSDKTY